MKNLPLALYGFISISIGILSYIIAFSTGLIKYIFFYDFLRSVGIFILVYSPVFIYFGVFLLGIHIFILLPRKTINRSVRNDEIVNLMCTVTVMAFNEEVSIGDVVRDFQAHPKVKRVVVIDNNSSDATARIAADSGAIVFEEKSQGYGQCFHRALMEGIAFEDSELTVLCEGDMTFRADDLDKFYSYIRHCDIVNGTRTVDQLQNAGMQLTSFMHFGNIFVGKMLEMRHLGRCTLSDVGTTYKMCRNDALRVILPKLSAKCINHEFNPYFIDRALEKGFDVIECPITFHKRKGVSKGGNKNIFSAINVGMRMMRGILFGWWDRN